MTVVPEEAATGVVGGKGDGAGGGREDVVVGCGWSVDEMSRAVCGCPYSDDRTGLSDCE